MPLVHRVKNEQARGRRILPFAKAGVSGRVPPRNAANADGITQRVCAGSRSGAGANSASQASFVGLLWTQGAVR
jgi:hypothetical protein